MVHERWGNNITVCNKKLVDTFTKNKSLFSMYYRKAKASGTGFGQSTKINELQEFKLGIPKNDDIFPKAKKMV